MNSKPPKILASKKTGIFKKIFIINTLLLFIIIVSLSLFNYNREKQNVKNNIVNTAQIISANILKSYEDHIISDLDYSFVEKSIRKIPENENIVYCLWYDKTQDILLSGGNEDIIDKISDDIHQNAFNTASLLQQEFIIKESKKRVIDVANPIIIQDHNFGILRIGFSNDRLIEIETDIKKAAFFYAVIFLVIGAALTYFVSKQIVIPLEKCTEGAIMFADGKYNHRIVVNSSDETKTLADSFNFMANKLQTTIEELDLKLYNLSALSQFNQMVNQTLFADKSEFYTNIIELINEMLFVKIGKLIIRTDAGDWEVTKIFGEDIHINTNSDILSECKSLHKVIDTKKSLLVENMNEFDYKDDFGEYFTQTMMIVPILFRKKILGVVIVGDKTINGSFQKKDIEFLEIITNEISLYLHNNNKIGSFQNEKNINN